MSLAAEPVAAQPAAAALLAEFDAWMKAEQRRVYLLCFRILQDQEEADCATQDAFLKAYRALQRNAEPIEDPAKWISRIAINTCLDRLRSRRWKFWRRRTRSEHEPEALMQGAVAQPQLEESIFAQQISRRLAVALERLTPRQRTIFVLRHYEGRSLNEISTLLNLDTGSIKSHLFRAVRKLRGELQDLYFGRGKE